MVKGITVVIKTTGFVLPFFFNQLTTSMQYSSAEEFLCA